MRFGKRESRLRAVMEGPGTAFWDRYLGEKERKKGDGGARESGGS